MVASRRFPPSKLHAWASHPSIHDQNPERLHPDSATTNRESYHSDALVTSGQYNRENQKCSLAGDLPIECKSDLVPGTNLLPYCLWLLSAAPNGITLVMRIGTWNVDNRRLTKDHRDLLVDQNCDIWLLTELHRSWANEAEFKDLHFHTHLSKGVMGRGQH